MQLNLTVDEARRNYGGHGEEKYSYTLVDEAKKIRVHISRDEPLELGATFFLIEAQDGVEYEIIRKEAQPDIRYHLDGTQCWDDPCKRIHQQLSKET
jgi:hypothetical protein